jgi:ABC-type multidrug transport system fused ATPase/permease subunit
VAQLVPLLVALFWIAPRLALAAIVALTPFVMLLSTTRRRWKRAHARSAREGELLLESADEAIRHADLWTTYGAERKARAAVRRLGLAIARHSSRLEASAAALSATNEVLGAFALVAALVAARAGLLGDAGSGGTLLSFTVAFFLAYRPLRDVTEARLAWGRAAAAFENLSEMAIDGEADAAEDARARADRSWPLARLDLRNVRLAHGGGPPLSMSIPPGHIVAVEGPTGAGKTTLLRALLGLDGPLGGDIRYDGVSLLGAPPGLQARPFAWVPQESPLLADTLDANVALGDAGPPSPGRAREVLDELGAGHLADELGADRLGAAGRAVSGGERQWIALARAIATRQPILLLDEPTSGLDAHAQQRVLDAIARLRGQRSVIIVTHRPEPLAIADSVVRVASAEA